MTLFLHFLFGGILPIMIFFLQNIPSTAALGDSMRWWFCFIPTYCIGHGIVWSSTWEFATQARDGYISIDDNKYDLEPLDTDVWAFQNLTGDVVLMIIVALVSTGLLILIEADIFQSCAKFSMYSNPEPRDDLDLDDDVIEEHERLA